MAAGFTTSRFMTGACTTDAANEDLRTAASRMWREQTGALLVVEGERLVGLLTERDLLRLIAGGADLDETSVAEAMSPVSVTATPDLPLATAARLMSFHGLRYLPVLDPTGRVLGMLSQRDVAGVFAALVRAPGDAPLATDRLVEPWRLVPDGEAERTAEPPALDALDVVAGERA